ncbi:MAG: TolC family protein [Acidobacteriia bacterium]|nr:TolC family protein [Terriglobia bacterium]
MLVALPGFSQTPEIATTTHRGVFNWLTKDYAPTTVPNVSFEDSPRLEKLMRAGIIYLSLRDAIALALENNLDIELARYNPRLADANLFRASAGALLRNVSSSISSGPSSASLGVLAGTALGSGGTGASTASSGQSGVLSGLNVQLAGTAIPNLDPTLFLQGELVHNTTIETATNITGTNFLVTQFKGATYGIQQGFLTGTNFTLGMSNQLGLTQNSPFAQFNPFNQASLSLNIQQNLLQGFRPSINNRAIRVARNQRHISDLTFKNQVMATVASVVNLYWDLVAFDDSLKVKQQTLTLDTKLYEDNKRRSELGAIAPIDIIQAEAEMKAAQQDVTTAESQVEQQEMILKGVLTRNGLNNIAIATARIVPTDRVEVPAQEPVRPVQDLITEAMGNRPDVEQSRIGMEDTRINTLGIKDAMLPQLSAFLNMSNSGVAGQVNAVVAPIQNPDGSTSLRERTAGDVNSFFLGGYGSVLGQIFGRNFPNYTAGLQLTIPLRNRAARADLVTDQLNYRQQQIQDRQLGNSIKVNVLNAWVAVRQARSAYDTSVEARRLQDQTFAGTRRKYELGTATILDVVITQRDDTTRQLAEVDALAQYVRARTNLQNTLGRILQDYDVSIAEAAKGVVARDPDPIPAVPPGAAANRTPPVWNGIKQQK